jgi:hypothetical protein
MRGIIVNIRLHHVKFADKECYSIVQKFEKYLLDFVKIAEIKVDGSLMTVRATFAKKRAGFKSWDALADSL